MQVYYRQQTCFRAHEMGLNPRIDASYMLSAVAGRRRRFTPVRRALIIITPAPRPSQDTDIHASTTTKQHTLTVILPNDLLQLLLAQARFAVHFMATRSELLRADLVRGVAQENLGQSRLFQRVVDGVGMCI